MMVDNMQFGSFMGRCFPFKIQETVRRFAKQMPTLEAFQGKYPEMVGELGADTFGTWGDELLLELLGIPPARCLKLPPIF